MTPDPTPASAAEVVLHQERLRIDLPRAPTQRVVFRKRIVTEVRQVEVTARREELVVEHLALTGGPGDSPGTAPKQPLLIVLTEGVPTVQLRTRPYERVTVDVHTVTEEHDVNAIVSRELVELSEHPAAP